MNEDKVPETVPAYRNPQFLTYSAGALTGVLMILRSLGIVRIFQSDTQEALFAGGVVSLGTCAYALYRRFKTGNDPSNPTPRLTLK